MQTPLYVSAQAMQRAKFYSTSNLFLLKSNTDLLDIFVSPLVSNKHEGQDRINEVYHKNQSFYLWKWWKPKKITLAINKKMNTPTRLQREKSQVVQHNYFIPSSSCDITPSVHTVCCMLGSSPHGVSPRGMHVTNSCALFNHPFTQTSASLQ